MKQLLVLVVTLFLTGCATVSKQSNADMSAFHDSQREVTVIKSTVMNPLPDCSDVSVDNQAHYADLSVPRSIRGYLKNKEGELCKKPD
ncbi:hypothetical protein [Haliea sp.]|jgi:uncharacterized lipoprotein YajG|uniref:hypothetical protein n=1 Tax=Haliea sp. TaxID=1932666 RepID=UPI00257B4498|nr:hypothetical protein [Haliea sp.]|tara:strand:+ start:22143 stop:22406 length:264 start_codon:yes stop_codon:yes gene_type:complete